jgi:hypothetical protein
MEDFFLSQRHKERKEFAEDLSYRKDGWIIVSKENIIRILNDRKAQKGSNHD